MNLNSKIIETETDKKNPILSLEQFIQRQNEIQKLNDAWITKWWNHKKLLKKVLKLSHILKEYFNENIDPIVYLEKLYFEENLSIESIVLKIKEIYTTLWETKHFYNSSNSMQKFLKEVLSWKLRDSSENKKTTVYKERTQENVKKSIKERHTQKRVEFLWWYIKNSNASTQIFDKDKFNNFEFKYQKFIYLLENVFFINKDNFYKLKELDIWNKFIADRFNEMFDELKIDFIVWHKDIKRVFEKY